MNPPDADRWKSDVLDHVFAALAADSDVETCLVFKGARVLNAILQGGRQSLDLDTNLVQGFVDLHPDRDDQKTFLERHRKSAITRYFERQEPVRFELKRLRVNKYPPGSHPMGWDAVKVKLTVDDLTKPMVKALPGLEIDVAAPEALLPTSIAPVIIGGARARAYSLERIAGEKMRAFLSSLPAYRAKVKKPGESVRAKDLYDLTRILQNRPIALSEFWNAVAQEFRIACRSRYIDCRGLETFLEQWDVTAQAYSSDSTIPRDIGIDDARSALEEIVSFMISNGTIPFENALPLPSAL